MFDSLHSIGSVSQTNGISVTEINQNDDETIEEDDEWILVGEQLEEPIKRTKFEKPGFLRKQTPPIGIWQSLEKQPPTEKLGIETICPNVCFYFLRDECVEDDKCYDLHELPNESSVSQALTACGTINSAKLFHVIVARCPKVLHRFFNTFITYFAEQNSKADLIAAIAICERERNKERQFTFFQQLTKALIKIVGTYTNAMENILENLHYTHSDVVDILLNINLVENISVNEFLSVFHSLNEKHYRFNQKMIERLMYLCTQSESILPMDKLEQFVRLIFLILKANQKTQIHKSLDMICYRRYLRLYDSIYKKR